MGTRLLIYMVIWFGVGYFTIFAAGLAAGCKADRLYLLSFVVALLSLIFGTAASWRRFLNR